MRNKERFARRMIARRRRQIALLSDSDRREQAKANGLPKVTIEQAERYVGMAKAYGVWA